MIKIKKERNKYLIEYIDYFNHYDYIEDVDSDSVDVKDEVIRNEIEKVKNDLKKLVKDTKVSSKKKD